MEDGGLVAQLILLTNIVTIQAEALRTQLLGRFLEMFGIPNTETAFKQ